MVFDMREGLAIRPRRAAIGAAASVGFGQDVLTAHLVPQAVEPVGCFALGFRPQPALQGSNRIERGW